MFYIASVRVWWGHLLEVAVDEVHAGFGEGVGGHVAAGDCPLVVLFGEDGADETDDRFAVGDDPDHVGAPAEFFVEAFLGVVRPDLATVLFGERGERQDVGCCVGEVVGGVTELLLELCDYPGVLGPGRRRVGLGEDGADQGGDHGLGGLRDPGEELRM